MISRKLDRNGLQSINLFDYLGFLLHQVICEEFSQCYDDVNICLWTNGSMLTQHDAKTVCQQRNESFLPRITNDDVQSKLEEFRFAARNLLGTDGFWIDVKAVGENDIHWIDGSPIAGLYLQCTVH